MLSHLLEGQLECWVLRQYVLHLLSVHPTVQMVLVRPSPPHRMQAAPPTDVGKKLLWLYQRTNFFMQLGVLTGHN